MFAQELGPDINKHAPYALATMNWIKKKKLILTTQLCLLFS